MLSGAELGFISVAVSNVVAWGFILAFRFGWI